MTVTITEYSKLLCQVGLCPLWKACLTKRREVSVQNPTMINNKIKNNSNCHGLTEAGTHKFSTISLRSGSLSFASGVFPGEVDERLRTEVRPRGDKVLCRRGDKVLCPPILDPAFGSGVRSSNPSSSVEDSPELLFPELLFPGNS